MKSISRRFASIAALAIVPCGLSLVPAQALAQEPTVRAQAVVNLTFDEPNGDALDSATAGAAKDNGSLVNGPARVKSLFWGQAGKQALALDAAAKQLVQIADSADVDRPDAVSFSLFFVNLNPAADAAYHGLIAKRDDGKSNITNYGVNFQNSGDAFQVYVNDGAGYKVATYSLSAAIGIRRPGFLTAVLQVGDAPAPDADTDKDDVLVQFYVNGQPLAPKLAAGGAILGNDAWLLDVKVASLVNDAPLTLGGSMPALEHTSGVIDEFSLFAKALTPAEVAKLFTEVAGPNVVAQIADEGKPVPAAPEIASTSLLGLQSGQTTVLVIAGTNLLPDPKVLLAAPIEKQVVRPTSNAGQIEVELTLAAGASPGDYALRVQTPNGVSGPLPMAVDALPQLAAAAIGDKPLTLPVALSGTVTGQQRVVAFFSGVAGQRVVADLECKRLGSAMFPVLELKNAQGTPLSIQWGHAQYEGDARIEAKLPADGVYLIELHDLIYNAPGQNNFRLKIGDLKIVDAVFPPGIAAGGQRNVKLIGAGIDPAAAVAVDLKDALPGLTQGVALPAALGIVGPVPGVLASEATEVVEEPQTAPALQTVNAQFSEKVHLPVAVSGVISQPDETDKYLLQVKPGMTLSLAAETRSIDSPLNPQISVLTHPEGTPLASSDDKPNLDFAVPANITAVQVAVRDLNGEGGPRHLYRLTMIPAGQPNFSLAVSASRLPLPRDGTAALRFDVTRLGYNGPIALSVQGAPEITLSPAEIPAGVTKGFVTVSAKSADASPASLLRDLRIVGESVGLAPPLRRAALAPAVAQLSMVPGQRGEVAAVLTAPLGVSLELGSLPPALFKGTETGIPLTINVMNPSAAGKVVRLTLLTTEAPRIANPKDPGKDNLPLVRSLAEQRLAASEKTGMLQIAVPGDVAEGAIDGVIRAELLPNAFSDKVLGTIDSRPFRLAVQNAIAVQLAAPALNLAGNAQTKFTGTVTRTAGFTGVVDVSLLNLPAGYAAPKVTLPAEQSNFELVITAPAVTAAADLPNIVLRVAGTNGTPLQADTPIATKIK